MLGVTLRRCTIWTCIKGNKSRCFKEICLSLDCLVYEIQSIPSLTIVLPPSRPIVAFSVSLAPRLRSLSNSIVITKEVKRINCTLALKSTVSRNVFLFHSVKAWHGMSLASDDWLSTHKRTSRSPLRAAGISLLSLQVHIYKRVTLSDTAHS